MPKLKAFFKSESDIPDEFKDYYVRGKLKDDGPEVFMLDVEQTDGVGLIDGQGLHSALNSERTARKEAEKKAKLFDGLDAEEAKKALKRLEELGDLDGIENLDDAVKQRVQLKEEALEGKFNKDKQTLEEHYQKQVGDLQTEIERTVSQLQNEMLSNSAIKAIAEHGGVPDLLMPLIQQRTRIENEDGSYKIKVLDESGSPMMTQTLGSSGDMSLSEFVGSLKNTDRFARAFDGSGASGSGSGSGSGGSGGGSGAAAGQPGNRKVFKSSQLKSQEGLAAYNAARDAQDAGTGPVVIVEQG